jgi:predicted nucleic acid-binding protein
MILVDTSVWIGHFRTGNARLHRLLEEDAVLTHPFIVGELACGSLRNRRTILSLLGTLPCAVTADHFEVLSLLENECLFGSGIGWVDAHLLASARLSHAGLWTLDRCLARIAASLGICA